MSTDLLTTPLFSLHQELSGKLVAFAGYQLPLSYRSGGLLAEHLHTRTAASLFDVSHMGQLQLPAGTDTVRALAQLVPADITAIRPGSAKYTLLTTEQGGVVDDCIITNDGEDGWFIIVNASRKAVDIAALQAVGIAVTEQTQRALLAVQGPAAAATIAAHFPAADGLQFMQSVRLTSDYGDCRISRCGYTGEDGFELSVPADTAEALARQLLMKEDCKPAGLGARDSLRLEAGLCLYGNELSETISPVEAGLSWTIPKSRRYAKASYRGAAAISGQIENGAPRRLAGLLPQEKTPVRGGAELYHNGNAVGQVTSGVYSPTLQQPIALALLTAEVAADAQVNAVVRGRDIACRQTALPFVAHRYHRKT